VKIVFMGTPDFAVPCLRVLLEDGHELCGVFSQPDKPKGRHYTLTPPPVKELAEQNGLPVFQLQTLRNGEALQILQTLSPDLIVVAAYGKILPVDILNLPPYGCINIHGSLLPKLRGAAPIQWAVLNGESRTGVTSMQMDAGMDTGDILLQAQTEIGPNETAGELYDRLSVLGAELLRDTLARLEAGILAREKQDESQATMAPPLTKQLCPLDWFKSAQILHDQVRGLFPWPAATARLHGKTLKIHRSLPILSAAGRPGEILEAKERLLIACGNDSALEILKLQPEGKKAMGAEEYLRGNPISVRTFMEI